MANTLLMAGGGFVFWLVAARIADPATVGLATATIGAIGAISLFARMGIDVSFIQLIPPLGESKRKVLISTGLILAVSLSFVGSVVFTMGTPLWSPELTVLASSLPIFLVFVLLTTINSVQLIFDSIYIAIRQAKWVLGTSLINQGARIAAVLGFAAFLVLQPRHIVFSYFGLFVISMLLSAFVILPRLGISPFSKVGFGGKWAREFLRGSVANSSPALLKIVPRTVGTIIILNRLGAAESGFYYILWLFGSIALFAPSAFEKTSLVQMVEGWAFSQSEYVKAGLVSLFSGLAVIAGGAFLLPLFGSFYARLSFVPLIPFALSTLPALVLQVRHSELRADKSYRLLTLSLSIVLLIFLTTIALFPVSVADVGWIWLAALLIGTGVAYANEIAIGKSAQTGRD